MPSAPVNYWQKYKELRIGNMPVGLADSRPAFSVGSIFNDGHSNVASPWVGDFDQKRSGRLLARVNEEASRYGCAAGVDIIAASKTAM